MTLLDSPSQFAPLWKWEAWAQRLNTFNPHDRTVVAEKEHANKMIAILREPVDDSGEFIPD